MTLLLQVPDERFKGALLEKCFSSTPSFLPTAECRGFDGTNRQFDYSISMSPFLIVAECKAMTRTIAIEHGSMRALRLRREKVVEASLEQIDEKARWLASHPKGRNYDIAGHTHIIPVGISAFREFIHTKALRFWLNDRTPRVLTPDELLEFLPRATLRTLLNQVKVVDS